MNCSFVPNHNTITVLNSSWAELPGSFLSRFICSVFKKNTFFVSFLHSALLNKEAHKISAKSFKCLNLNKLQCQVKC